MNVWFLIGSCLTASLSPGPAALSTIETSLRYGKRRTFWHTLGLAIGETPHLFLALYGTHWLTVHVPYALQLIGFAGMSYFLYLGLGLLLHRRPPGHRIAFSARACLNPCCPRKRDHAKR